MKLTAKQASRIRWEIKKGSKKVSESRRAALAEYDRAMGRPPMDDAPPSDPDAAQSQATEPHSSEGTAPQTEPIEAAPSVEPPPHVAPPSSPSSGTTGKKSGDWREPYREAIAFNDDGRQMICEMVGGGIAGGLAAMCEEMRQAGINPFPGPIQVDPRKLHAMFVLAADDVMPARARLTPKVGAAVATAVIVGRRYYYAKQIAEALKHNPEHQKWLREQAEREKAEHAQRAAHEAEVKAAEAAKQPTPQYADPTPPSAPSSPSSPPSNGAARADLTSPDAIF